MLEEGAFSAPGGEVLYSLNVVHPFARIAELGPTREVVASLFARPLDAQGKLAGLGGRLYVLVKLRMKTSVKSSQLLAL